MKKMFLAVVLSFFLGSFCFAQTYEKASDTVLKVTAPVSTDYDITKIKERLVDLADYIKVAEGQIAQFNLEIQKLQNLLVEAEKVGIDTNKVTP